MIRGNLNNIIKILSGGAMVLTYNSWFESNKQSILIKQLKDNLNSVNNEMVNLNKVIANTTDENIKNKLIARVQEIEENYRSLNNNLKNI